ncbi:MAG TPA: methyltransferase domain-containing protein [Burkholderiaceae bacterium]|nr:methyltransferase domain-containing protein [Burkholderiaceae bacterium]
MLMARPDTGFTGSIPEFYERHLVPLIFEPYAQDLADRLGPRAMHHVLEVAAGTGVVTRALARRLPAAVGITATDLNPAMLDEAQRVGTARPVRWQPADAMALPFDDARFDAVVCQFGAMFFPDKPRAYAELRRVLRPGGLLLFNVWDRIESNEFAAVVTDALAEMFPHDPPRFLARTPHGHADPVALRRDLADAGFEQAPRLEVVARRSRAARAADVALAYCEGTPLRNEIEARDPTALPAATQAATQALAARFGDGPVDGLIQALVIAVER